MGSQTHEVRQRSELEAWLVDPPPPAKPPVVMFLRGNGAAVTAFEPTALLSAQRFGYRELVWVKNAGILSSDEITKLFNDDDSVIAVALSIRHEPKGWVNASQADALAAEKAYLAAGKK